jgi:hypothetical protein
MGLKKTLTLAVVITLVAGAAWAQNSGFGGGSTGGGGSTAGGGATGSWGGGNADGDSALEEMCGYLLVLWTWARGITYTMASIGLVWMAIKAYGGKFEMNRLISWGFVLFLFSSTPMALAFMTEGAVADVQCGVSPGGPASSPQ